MADTNRYIKAEFRAGYVDLETIQQQLQNCISHAYTLEDIIDYKHTNMFLTPTESYAASNQNFLFMASNVDLEVTIDGTKQFALTEFFLVQREYAFSFEIKPIVVPDGCNVNLHIMHGKLRMG